MLCLAQPLQTGTGGSYASLCSVWYSLCTHMLGWDAGLHWVSFSIASVYMHWGQKLGQKLPLTGSF